MSPAARDSFRSLASALKASGSAGKRDHPVAALLLVTVSMALLVGIAVVGRGAALSGMDPTQALFFRNFFCVVWMLPLFAWRGLSLVKTSHFRLYGIRVRHAVGVWHEKGKSSTSALTRFPWLLPSPNACVPVRTPQPDAKRNPSALRLRGQSKWEAGGYPIVMEPCSVQVASSPRNQGGVGFP